VEFLIEVVERAPAGEAHIILDNLSAQESGDSRFSGYASERAFPLHADVFVVASAT
jgi:hypothetical protein